MTLSIKWEGIDIAISHTINAFNTGFHHIELRAEDPIPVTETGYRSHFLQPEAFDLFDGVEDFVRQWLDEHDDDAYRARLNQSKQMELF